MMEERNLFDQVTPALERREIQGLVPLNGKSGEGEGVTQATSTRPQFAVAGQSR